MKKLITILLLAVAGNLVAQQKPAQFISGLNVRGEARDQLQVDSLFYMPYTDTLKAPGRAGVLVYKFSNNKPYYYDGIKYQLFLSTSDTAAMLANYLKAGDTTGRWIGIGHRYVDTAYAVNDSTLAIRVRTANGNFVTTNIVIKGGASTGGGGTNQTLQQVLNTGNQITVSSQLIKGTGFNSLLFDSLGVIDTRYTNFIRFRADGGQASLVLRQTNMTLTAGDSVVIATPSLVFSVQPPSRFYNTVSVLTHAGTPGTDSVIVKKADGTLGSIAANYYNTGGVSGWTTTGNAGTVDGTNFLGTTNDVPLSFRVNNVRAGYLGNTSTFNTFFGATSGAATTTGTGNTAVGWGALASDTSGGNNVAMGFAALNAVTKGQFNTGIGLGALSSVDTGNHNTAVGNNALNASTGNNNTAVGNGAFVNVTTGHDNIGLGNDSLGNMALTTGSYNTIIGLNNPNVTPTTNNSVLIATGKGTERLRFDSVGNLKTYPQSATSDTTTYKADVVDASGNHKRMSFWPGGGGGTPGGSNTQVQYNNSGAFGGDARFTFNSTTKTLFIDTLSSGLGKFDSLKLNQTYPYSLPDSLITDGDSFTFGLYATTSDSDYVHRLSKKYGLSLTNLAISATGIWHSASDLNTYLQPGHRAMTSVMAGYNNLRFAGGTNKTYRMIINGYKSIFASQNIKNFSAGGSSGDGANLIITRYGTWTTNYLSNTVGGRGGSNGAVTNTANDSVVCSFTGNNILFFAIGSDGSGAGYIYATPTIFIDGVSQGSFSENNQADGVSDCCYDNKRSPMVLFFTGLSSGIHKIKIVNDNTNYLVIDGFGQLKDPINCTPLLLWHAAYDNITGYAVSPSNSSVAITQALNTKIDSLFATPPFNSGYPVFKVQTNNRFDTLTGLYTDNIHPSDIGHAQLSQAALDALSTINIYGTEGVIRRAGNAYYGESEGVMKKFLMQGESGNGLDSTQVILNQTVQQTGANFNISGTGKFSTAAKIGSSVLQTDAAFVAGTNGGNPTMSFYNSSASTNNKIFDYYTDGTNLYGRLANDAMSSAMNWLQVNRTGTTLNWTSLSTKVLINSTTDNNIGAIQVNGNSTTSTGGNLTSIVGLVSPSTAPITFGVLSSTHFPYQGMYNSSAGSNLKNYDFYADDAGVYHGRLVDDAVSNANDWLTITRTSYTSAKVGFPSYSGTGIKVAGFDANGNLIRTSIDTGSSGGGSDTLKVVNVGVGEREGYANLDTLFLKSHKGLNSISVTSSSDSTINYKLVNDTAFTTSLTDYVYGWNFERGAGALGFSNKLSLSGDLKLVQSSALIQSTGTTYSSGGYDKLVRNISTGKYEIQPGAPSYFTPATGGTVSLANNAFNIINPSGALATLTVNLPSSPADGDYVEIKFTQAVTAITFANGTVADGITAPSAGGYYKYVFRATGSTWY